MSRLSVASADKVKSDDRTAYERILHSELWQMLDRESVRLIGSWHS